MSLDLNKENQLVVCGFTMSTDVFGEGGFQSEYGGGITDGWIALFKDFDLYTAEPEPHSVCVGETLKVPFVLEEPLDNEVEFKAYLSDSSGNIYNSIIIGSKYSNNSDTILAVIPDNLPDGKDYLLRVGGSSNEQNIYIEPKPEPEFSGPVHVCSQTPQHYTAIQIPGHEYKWSLKHGIINTPDNSAAITCSWTMPA
jgi:hypothetical protein